MLEVPQYTPIRTNLSTAEITPSSKSLRGKRQLKGGYSTLSCTFLSKVPLLLEEYEMAPVSVHVLWPLRIIMEPR